MKKILKVIIFAIIFYLCIVPYQCTKAENETETEAPVQTGTNNQETESNQNEENKPGDPGVSDENKTNEEDEVQPANSDSSNTSSDSGNTSGTGNASSVTRPQQKTITTQQKSSNANLVNLGMKPNDFKGFKPGTLEYNVTVPNDVEKVNVYAKTQDAKAQITSGTGEQILNVGNNAIKILVTAENGATQTYTINVTREEAIQEEVENKEVVTESDLKKLEIKGYKLTPNFSADIYEYQLNVKQDVTDLDVLTEGLNDKVSIEVAGNKDLKER